MLANYLFSGKARACYIGYVGYGNLGDEALFQATHDLLKDDIAFFVPPTGSRLLRVTRYANKFLDVKYIFLGGGTLIKANPYRMQILRSFLVRHPDAHFVTFGTGVGDADFWESVGLTVDKAAWQQVLESCKFLSVRGQLSKNQLERWGIQNDIHVIGDPALWFARDAIKPKSHTKRIGVNLGPSAGYIHGGDENYILEFGARLLRTLHQDGWQVTLFPMIQADLDYMEQAVRLSGVPEPRIMKNFLDLQAVIEALEAQDVFIGEKLHSVVLASCAYTPAVMLEYRPKCRDFMLSIDRGDWTFKTDHLDLDAIYARINALYDDIPQHQQQLFDKLQVWKATLRSAAATVVNLTKDASQSS